jgi:hypothetical protein
VVRSYQAAATGGPRKQSIRRTNLKRPAERIVKFYNGRGTAEQWIREDKLALRWTRLSCRAFRDNAVASHSVSNRPISLLEAAKRSMLARPTMARMAGSWASRWASLTSS